MFNFFEEPLTAFRSSCIILYSNQHCTRVLISLHPHKHYFLVFFFFVYLFYGGSHTNESEIQWYLIGLICISLMTGNTEHLFMCILVICIFSTEKCVSGSLPILNQVVCFFVVEFYFTLYCRHQIYDLKYFYPFCGLPFYSIDTVFWCTSI